MFGHLKAEEFVNLTDGVELAPQRRAHLDACPRCTATWKAMTSVHSEFSMMDSDIPEPNWEQFRNSVRTELLSRSVQRASAVRRWTGWPIRPAMAWGLSLVLAVVVTTGGVLWHLQGTNAPAAGSNSPVAVPADAGLDAFSEWSHVDPFDDLVNLEEQEQEALRRMLSQQQ